MEKQKRGVSLVGPIILIGLGIVFLLNNLGMLDWNVWDVIFRLWPVLIIAAGLEILLGRRSALGSLVALALTLALVIGLLWLFGSGIVGQPAETETIRQTLGEATQAEVTIAPAVGTLHVESLSESANLAEGTVHLSSGERLARDFVLDDETAEFTLRSEGNTYGPFTGTWGDERAWDLSLNPDVPLELDVSLAVGQSEVDLTGLMVSDLDVSMAVGQTTVILPDEGDFRMDVEGAIGQIIVVVPEGMAARVRLDTALVGRQVPDEYRRGGDVYTSPGYESAENRVDLEVDLAIGSVTIRNQ